jgi:hypothetical protein
MEMSYKNTKSWGGGGTAKRKNAVYGDAVRGAGGIRCLPKDGVLYAGRHRGVLRLSKDVLHKVKYCSEYSLLQAQIQKNFDFFAYSRRAFRPGASPPRYIPKLSFGELRDRGGVRRGFAASPQNPSPSRNAAWALDTSFALLYNSYGNYKFIGY